MAFVRCYGRMWARNPKNLKELRRLRKLRGVYLLHDGSMPVYVGRGEIFKRLARHLGEKGKYWDHFSWFEIPKDTDEVDAESLLLKILPYYLRPLNKKSGSFVASKRIAQADESAILFKKPKSLRAR